MSRVVKRVGDRVAAAGMLVLFSPVFAGVAVWILLDDGRPVLLRQERVGKHGRPFRMLKFRTMVPNAIERRPQAQAQRRPVRDRPERPAHHARRALSAPQRPRRAAAALERAARRDEPRRAAARRRRAGCELLRARPSPARRRAGHHRLVAGERPRGDQLARTDRAGPLVHRALVARTRRQDPVANGRAVRRTDEQPVVDTMNIERARAREKAEST